MFGYKSLSEAVSIIFAVVNPFYTGISGIYGIFAVSKICSLNVSFNVFFLRLIGTNDYVSHTKFIFNIKWFWRETNYIYI